MSFIKHSDAAPVCRSKPLDSVKNWNDHFFWVDSTAFPISVSLKSKILSKDPHPKLSRYETEAFDFLRTHTVLFQKFLEPFYCVTTIPDVFLLLAEMDLFAFICHSDPTKVQIGDRDLAEREIKLLKTTEGRTVPLDPPVAAASGDSGDSIDKLFDEGNNAGQEHSVERDDDVLEETVPKDASEVVVEKAKEKQKRKIVGDASGSTFPPKKLREDYYVGASSAGGKSLATIRDLVPNSSSVPSGVIEPPTVVSLPPTPDNRPTDFVFGLNLRTCPPSLRYVVSSNDSHRSSSCSEIKSFARSPAKDVPVTIVAFTTTVTADASIVLLPRVRVVSKNLEIVTDSTFVGGDLDSDTLLRIYVPKWHVKNDFVLDDLAPRQVYLSTEVRMQAEHTLEKKGELEDKCAEQAALLSERDAEIIHLKEVEAIEAIRLRSQLTVVEAADTAKGGELRDLKEKNFALEGERDVMSEKIATLESANLSRDDLDSKVASLESERDCLITQAIGCVVNKGIQARLKAGIDHGQAGRDLSVVEAYDPSAKAKYIDAMNALGAGTLVEIPGAENLQPSPEQLMLLVHRPKDDVVIGETSISSSLHVVQSRVQRFRGEVKDKHLSLADVMTPFAE
ncbi:hypothetical protein Tco_1423216, partial [Tanacetum coccineum]